MKSARRSRLAVGIAAAGAAGLVAATLAVSAGTGSAEPGSLTLHYTCPFPLIGNQQVSVEISTDLPATVETGAYTPQISIKAISNAGQTATEGLRLVGASTLEGSALATSTVSAPQGNLAVQLKTDIPKQDIPAVGNDLVVEATGAAPALRFDEPGTATLTVNELALELTPKRPDGTPTELGTFTSACTQDPGQENLLHTFEVTGEPTTPEALVGSGSTPPMSQVYSCPFPLIGTQQVSVDINTELPGSIEEGKFTPQIDIHAVSNAGETATQGLRLIGA